MYVRCTEAPCKLQGVATRETIGFVNRTMAEWIWADLIESLAALVQHPVHSMKASRIVASTRGQSLSRTRWDLGGLQLSLAISLKECTKLLSFIRCVV